MKGKEKIVRTNIFLKASQMRALKMISQQTDVPLARLIRRAADLLLKEARR